MKTIMSVVLIGMLTLMAPPTQAQLVVDIGVIGGVNYAGATFDVDDLRFEIKESNIFRLGFGLVLDAGLKQGPGLRIEPMFLQKGLEITSIFLQGQESTAKFKFSYLEVPVLLRLAMDGGMAKLYVMGGPSVGLLLSAKQSIDGEFGFDEDVKDEFKDFDFGLIGGGGISIGGPIAFFIEGRYALGLSDISDGDSKIKNRGFQVFSGITLHLDF